MRIRAGIVLIKENKVALIERHRAALRYFVFPGGGMNEGESAEQAAVREAREELPQHTNVYLADIARLVVQSIKEGWIQKPILTFEESKERSRNA